MEKGTEKEQIRERREGTGIHASGDTAEGNGTEALEDEEVEGGEVAGAELAAALADGPHRVDHVLGWQPVPPCDLGLAHLTAVLVHQHALFHQALSCCLVDGPVNPSSSQQGGFGRIDNGSNLC